MVEENESAPKEAALCEECKKNPSKYKCPGCSIRTCSLPCVESHKHRTSCTGKKQYTEIVPISQFDDNLLLSDYNMLEEVKRIADSGRRRFKKPSHLWLPNHFKRLRSVVANRGIKLVFLSNGMSKREKNQSFYNNRTKLISWTMEWKFHSTDVVLTDHRVDEKRSLSSIIENHLKPGPWRHRLRQFCDEPLDALQFFIRTNPRGTRSPLCKLDINASLREQLANLVIIEYPVILVYLPQHSYDFEIINTSMSRGIKVKETVKNDVPCQPGIIFKEEEIEEGSSSEPRVSDLMETAKTSTEMDETPNTIFNSGEIQDFVSINDATNTSCKFDEFSDLDVDIQQGWDAIYANLMAESSSIPEDFLQINGVSVEQSDLLGVIGGADFTIMDNEELEEGEIE